MRELPTWGKHDMLAPSSARWLLRCRSFHFRTISLLGRSDTSAEQYHRRLENLLRVGTSRTIEVPWSNRCFSMINRGDAKYVHKSRSTSLFIPLLFDLLLVLGNKFLPKMDVSTKSILECGKSEHKEGIRTACGAVLAHSARTPWRIRPCPASPREGLC